MHRLGIAVVLGVLLAVGVAGATATSNDNGRAKSKIKRASAVLVNAAGQRVGRVTLVQRRGKVLVAVRARGLTPGFHGFHVHTVGKCEAPGFTSAAGHLKFGDQAHGDHAGDMPVLLVNRDGTASSAFETGRFKLADLRDADGSAVIVHSGRDNYANIPTRYAPAPDAETLNTGDAGSRVACGVIRRP
jgi:Cu-Zn family superoxide dismutase